MTKWWRRILAALTAGLFLAAANSVPALAIDDYLVLSSPQRHAEIDLQPGWVTLVFRSEANAKLAKVLVLDASGANVTVGSLIVEGTNVTTQLNLDLPTGTYTVLYRTSGSDKKVRGGSYQFAYGKGNWTSEQKEVWIGKAEQPPVLDNPDPNATTTATPTESAPPTDTATPTAGQPSDSASPATGPSFAPQTGTGTAGSGALPWLIGGGVLVLVAAGVGGWFVWKRRQS